MTREPHIPLFLWVATALVVHALGGGGATEVVKVLEERLDIRSFAGKVRSQARLSGQPLEVSFEPEEPEALEEPDPESDEGRVEDDDLPKAEPDPVRPEPEPEKKAAVEAPKPPEPKPAEEKAPEQAEEKAQKLVMLDNRRVAVDQHVEDENQADNPDAEFAGEHANRVKEQTQARITSTDQNDPKPTPGGNFAGSEKAPGNSEEARVAQSEERAGDPDLGPGEAGADTNEPEQGAQASAPPSAAGSPAAAHAASPPPEEARAASTASAAAPNLHDHDHGTFTMPRPNEARKAATEQKWQPPKPKQQTTDLLGFGSLATTKNGVNLNLSHAAARTIVGADSMARIRRRAGEQRLAQHRGSWQNLGIERWRSAIENYVATVKLGNQTALNTARVPFAQYLNQIHQRIHGIFADGFLRSLEGLPPDHPLSNQNMSTHIEIALDRQDGSIVKMGVTKSSGVTMFDVGALESVKKAAPYGVPPGSIVSSDGNVYFHWEFHRLPEYACSTYFARPFILNIEQKPAPPVVPPPTGPTYEETRPDSRSGALERTDEPDKGG